MDRSTGAAQHYEHTAIHTVCCPALVQIFARFDSVGAFPASCVAVARAAGVVQAHAALTGHSAHTRVDAWSPAPARPRARANRLLPIPLGGVLYVYAL